MPNCFSLCNIIMSIITGVISGLVATGICYLLGRKNRFNEDKQAYIRYILQIKAALTVSFLQNNTSEIRIMLEQRPILKNIHSRSLFKIHRTDDIDGILSEIHKCLDNIVSDINGKTLLEKQEFQYQRELSLPMMDLLKLKY